MRRSPPSRAGPDGVDAVLPGRGRRPSPLLVTAGLALLIAATRIGGLAERLDPARPAEPAVVPGSPAAEPAAGREAGEEPAVALLDSLLPLPSIEPAAGPPAAGPPAPSEPAAGAAPKAAAPTERGPSPRGDPLADVAAELARRAAELDRRERDLVLREAAALAVETRLSEQLGRLESLKKELETLAAEVRGRDDAELAQLVKTYEAMKARNAAQVFDQLALDVLLPIVRRMREAKLAAVLAAMEPAKAKQVTAALAQARPLPRLP